MTDLSVLSEGVDTVNDWLLCLRKQQSNSRIRILPFFWLKLMPQKSLIWQANLMSLDIQPSNSLGMGGPATTKESVTVNMVQFCENLDNFF